MKKVLAGLLLSAVCFAAAPPKQAHTVVIIGENHSYSKIIGNTSAPYINWLASQHTSATNYDANTHPSIGNYFMLTTGQIVTNSDGWTGTITIPDLVTEMLAGNVSWKAYVQSLPYDGYIGGDVSPYYVKHHNPFAYFQEVRKNSTLAKNSLLQLPHLDIDLAAGTLPQFVYVLPDMAHDAHNCPVGMSSCTDNQKIAAFDAFVSQTVEKLRGMPDWSSTVVYVTFDEGNSTDTAGGGGHIICIAAGGAVKRGYKVTRFAQEQSLLRTIEFNLGIPAQLGKSASATSFYDIWQ